MLGYRADDLYRTFNAFGAIANNSTGLGTTRDKSTDISVIGAPLLSERERIDLFVNSRICRRVVETYCLEAGESWVEFTFGETRYKKYGFNPDALVGYFNDLKTGDLKSAIIEASIEARWHGSGYLLLGIDDGGEWNKPVDEGKIRSLRWVEPLYEMEVSPDISYGGSYLKPEYYQINRFGQTLPEGDRALRVHRSRILLFHGDKLTGAALYRRAGKHLSVLQAMFSAYAQCMQGLAASSAMLQDYSVFLYKFAGLQDVLREHREKVKAGDLPSSSYPQDVLDRFLAIQMGMSTIKGIIMDGGSMNLPGEDAQFISRNFGGIDAVLDRLTEQMIAATDMPRSKVLGTANQVGLGAEGRGEQDRYAWAQMVAAWQENNWRAPLMYLTKIALLAKDGPTGGRLPTGYGLQFSSTLQMTDAEKISLRKTHLEGMNIAIAAGVLNPYEVRMSTYGGAQWSSEVTLDEEVSEKMREGMFPADEEKENAAEVPTDEEPADGEKELAQDNDYTQRSDALYGVWFKGRNTCTIVNASSRDEAISKARKKKVAGNDQPVVSAKQLTGKDLKDARAGRWVRTRAGGGKSSAVGSYKYRPQLKNIAKGQKFDSVAPIIESAENLEEFDLVGDIYEIQSTSGFKYAVGFDSAVDAESEFLKTISVDDYIGITDVTDDLGVLLNERTDASDTLVHVRGNLCRKNGRFVACDGSKATKSKTKKTTESKVKKITDKTTIAELKAIAEAEGVKLPDKGLTRRQTYITAIEDKVGDKYKTTRKSPRKPEKPPKNKDDLESLINKVDRSKHEDISNVGHVFVAKFVDDEKFKKTQKEKDIITAKLEALAKYQELIVARQEGALINGKKVLAKDVDTIYKEMRKLDKQSQKLRSERTQYSKTVFDNLKSEIKKRGLSENEAREIVDKLVFEEDISPGKIKQIKETHTEFLQLTNGKGSKSLQSVSAKAERAYASRYSGHADLGKDLDPATHFHEAAHHVEYESEKLTLAANAWRNSRATSQTVSSLNKIIGSNVYDEGEEALPDTFVSPYVGKVYRGNKVNESTEVVSMGIERFSSPSSMASFYAADKAHFEFTVGVLLTKD